MWRRAGDNFSAPRKLFYALANAAVTYKNQNEFLALVIIGRVIREANVII